MTLSVIATGTVGSLYLSGRTEAASTSGRICQVNEVVEAPKKCTSGEIILFTPSFFGNEQLPVIAAAALCDFNKPIVWTTGGVSCVFTDERKGFIEK